MAKKGIAALAIVMLAAGCASMRGPSPMTAEQTDALKARLGKIGVVGGQYLPALEIQTPAKGAGAGALGGAAVGAMAPFEMMSGGMSGCNSPGCVLLPAVLIALVPVGATIGAVGGAITAESAEKVNERQAKIDEAVASLRMQDNLRDRLSARVTDLKTFPVTMSREGGPSLDGQKPDYRRLKSEGIDTVNEVAVRKLSLLSRKGKVKPELAVQLTAQVRLVSTADDAELYSQGYSCESATDKFEAWAAAEARKFRDEIDRCYNDIAGHAVKDLYINDTLLR